MSNEKDYIIISRGQYSSYHPYIYVGNGGITEEQLQPKAREITDELIAEYEELPEREEWNSALEKAETVKYNPQTNDTVNHPGFKDFHRRIKKWLKSEGYEPLPDLNEMKEIHH